MAEELLRKLILSKRYTYSLGFVFSILRVFFFCPKPIYALVNVHTSGHCDDPRNLRVYGRTINTPFDGRPEDENDVTVSAGEHGEIRTKRPCLHTVSNGGPTTAHLNAIIVIVFDDPPCGPGGGAPVWCICVKCEQRDGGRLSQTDTGRPDHLVPRRRRRRRRRAARASARHRASSCGTRPRGAPQPLRIPTVPPPPPPPYS